MTEEVWENAGGDIGEQAVLRPTRLDRMGAIALSCFVLLVGLVGVALGLLAVILVKSDTRTVVHLLVVGVLATASGISGVSNNLHLRKVFDSRGIASIGKSFPWGPEKVTLIPWSYIYAIYISDSDPLHVCPSFIKKNEDGTLQKAFIGCLRWSGDWTKVLSVIRSNLSEYAVKGFDEWYPGKVE